jgi:NAD(P)-dependent dehydrogenase (short-subunit alcohol dehydrogenase family)
MADLNKARVVVTGGSSGIGRATAQLLAQAGSEVCIVARGQEQLRQVAEELGAGVWSHACDVADCSQIKRLAELVRDRWGAVDGLVSCAGIAPMAAAEATDLQIWDQTFAVNVRGPFAMAVELLPLLRSGDGPVIVNVSSTLAEKAIPGMAAYNASKAALNQLTRSMALELAPKIRVVGVMPAVVDTPIHESRNMTRKQVEAMGRLHPLRRIGQPEDVARTILFLLSEDAAWTTGAVMPVDGGMLAT